MTDFSIEELDAVKEALGKLREEQEEKNQLHMGFTNEDVKKRVPILTDKPNKYIHSLLETLEKAGERIEVNVLGIGGWKFI